MLDSINYCHLLMKINAFVRQVLVKVLDRNRIGRDIHGSPQKISIAYACIMSEEITKFYFPRDGGIV